MNCLANLPNLTNILSLGQVKKIEYNYNLKKRHSNHF